MITAPSLSRYPPMPHLGGGLDAATVWCEIQPEFDVDEARRLVAWPSLLQIRNISLMKRLLELFVDMASAGLIQKHLIHEE